MNVPWIEDNMVMNAALVCEVADIAAVGRVLNVVGKIAARRMNTPLIAVSIVMNVADVLEVAVMA